MARQNYSHGKRQRELAKKQKREEKAQRRLARKEHGPGEDPEQPQQQPVANSEPESSPA